ncbi:MAG: S-ribosylhomocysteine lyase [Ruminococcaceae bacterium]|nr:S-ribosylhomocysteine lyase [Oscillospiraceae bacterium]
MELPKKIESFKVDHDYITPGIYISRRDGDITTYDMRTRRPNMGEYMDNRTMHSLEHMFATFVRSSEIGDKVIYFGPMGCQTGFYLLVRDADDREVLDVVKKVLCQIIEYEGEVFGASHKECGNYENLDLGDAKRECRAYLEALEKTENTDFKYPMGE